MNSLTPHQKLKLRVDDAAAIAVYMYLGRERASKLCAHIFNSFLFHSRCHFMCTIFFVLLHSFFFVRSFVFVFLCRIPNTIHHQIDSLLPSLRTIHLLLKITRFFSPFSRKFSKLNYTQGTSFNVAFVRSFERTSAHSLIVSYSTI